MNEHIDQLISEDNYSQAIQVLNDSDPTKTDNLDRLKEKTYLNYGLYLEYRGPKDSSMRDRMTSALEQYIKVLNLNPKNQKARKEIKQIMGIYSTMPDKSPGEEIVSDLRKLGFDY
ncbi:hypothetical protein [Fodinibius saliphilus]|uniref:hypothetical protein n=1 Tax=Fodinibius saliphilus TaxID=1920650 RepID=UPI001486A04D|nr:hypothetical protein [Fodinibius saliphilus]